MGNVASSARIKESILSFHNLAFVASTRRSAPKKEPEAYTPAANLVQIEISMIV